MPPSPAVAKLMDVGRGATAAAGFGLGSMGADISRGVDGAVRMSGESW